MNSSEQIHLQILSLVCLSCFVFFSLWRVATYGWIKCGKVFLVHKLNRKKKRKRQVIRKKWMGESDMSLMTAHQMISVIKVWWRCHQRTVACQLLEHYGRVISWDISVRLSELYSKRYSECNLKREVWNSTTIDVIRISGENYYNAVSVFVAEMWDYRE